jgi:hypothetical protein
MRQPVLVTCECGATVNQRGLGSHRAGQAHFVSMERVRLEAEGLKPVAQQYRQWADAAGIHALHGPLNWIAGRIGVKGKITHALYVPAWFAEIVGWALPAALRRAIVAVCGRLDDDTLASTVGAARAMYVLDSDAAEIVAFVETAARLSCGSASDNEAAS